MAFVVLPQGTEVNKPQDPDWNKAEQLFRIRYHYAVSNAQGIERFAFRVLPYSLLRSFALTFDPTEKFRIAGGTYTAPNRTRTRTLKSLLNSRNLIRIKSVYSYSHSPNASLCVWLPASESTTVTTTTTAQSPVPDYSITAKDTTKRTRTIGSDQGGFESFTYSLNSPNRRVVRSEERLDHTTSVVPCPLPSLGRSRTVDNIEIGPGAAIFASSNIAALRADAISRTETMMTNKLSSLLAASLPTARRYTIARNVIELKDLPRSVQSLQRLMADLRRASELMTKSIRDKVYAAKVPEHVPEEWLSFWFGWRQMYKDLTELLEAPEKISKEINFLMSRRGKPTTIRRSLKAFAGDESTTPTWTYNPTTVSGTGWSETQIANATRHTREHELRIVLNLIFDFPTVGVPKFRKDLFIRKMGFIPTAADAYNLVPWTWLVDWFTGLGNYVDIVDNINNDPSLINWGVVTGITTGKIITDHTTSFNNVSVTAFRIGSGPVDLTTVTTPVVKTHSSVLSYKAIVRKDITGTFGVRSTLKPESMTPYQQSIVGAIIASRNGIKK